MPDDLEGDLGPGGLVEDVLVVELLGAEGADRDRVADLDAQVLAG